MINKTRDWETAEAATNAARPQLTPGGHIVKILNAKVITENWTGKNEEKLQIDFDICEGSELDNIIFSNWKRKKEKDSTAAWPKQGTYKIAIYDPEVQGATNRYFKGFITCVLNSNPGYVWNWNEETLKGKKVGMVFRDSPFVSNTTGDVVHFASAAFPCDADKAFEQPIPKPKDVKGLPPDIPAFATDTMQEAPTEKLPWDD